ncbi:MAG: hypothetical protein M3R16_05275 [Pseudomonadota bacterium]|nr:hypothetical protein [Pseudomonadota bacterium]
MKTQLPFPQHLHWTVQDITDAVPLRLFEMVSFDACLDAATRCANELPRRAWRHAYARPAALPAFVRIHS